MKPKTEPAPVGPSRQFWNVYGGTSPTFGSTGWKTPQEAAAGGHPNRIACLEITTTVRNIL